MKRLIILLLLLWAPVTAIGGELADLQAAREAILVRQAQLEAELKQVSGSIPQNMPALEQQLSTLQARDAELSNQLSELRTQKEQRILSDSDRASQLEQVRTRYVNLANRIDWDMVIYLPSGGQRDKLQALLDLPTSSASAVADRWKKLESFFLSNRASLERVAREKGMQDDLQTVFSSFDMDEEINSRLQELTRENYYFANEEAFNKAAQNLEGLLQQNRELITTTNKQKEDALTAQQRAQELTALLKKAKWELDTVDGSINLYGIRQQNLKSHPFNELAKCGDQKVSRIDLSRQFPPTKDQGKYGTCYSYAGVALVEAALYRNNIKDGAPNYQTHNYNPDMAAICSISSQGVRECRQRIENYTQEQRTCSASGLTWGGHPEDIVSSFLRQSDISPLQFSGERQYQAQINAVNAQIGCRIGTSTPIDELAADMQRVYESLLRQEATQNDLPSMEGYYKQQLMSLNSTHITELINEMKEFGELIDEPRDGKNPVCTTGNPYENRIKGVMNSLCSGNPVSISIFTPGLQFRDDNFNETDNKWHRGTWHRTSIEPDKPHAYHAMVVTGVDRDERGLPVFIMRNSWKVGDANNPNASESRLSFDEMCRAISLFNLSGPEDKKRRAPKGQFQPLPSQLGIIEPLAP